MHVRLLASFFLLFFVISVRPILSYAQTSPDLTVAPVVIDEKAKARDILNEKVVIKNTSSRKLFLYPTVKDVVAETGATGFVQAQDSTERAASLANWVELSRGVIELGPGEEKPVPFVIRANLNATPGIYHVYITFGEGSTREEAEAKAPLSTVTINLELLGDVKEIMQLNKFTTENVYFAGDDVRLSYQFENIGNQELTPAGEIVIYDRKGSEVATIEINKEGKAIASGQMIQLASVWSQAKGFGKFKALLSVHYGADGKGTLQDTIFFWIIPWKQLLGAFIVGVLLVILFVIYFHGKFSLRKKPRPIGDIDSAVMVKAAKTPVAVVAQPQPQPLIAEPSVTPVVREGFFKRIAKGIKNILLSPFRLVAGLFKRKNKSEPSAAHVEAADTSVRAEIAEDSRERRGLREALDSTPSLSPRGGPDDVQGTVIDLKKMRHAAHPDADPEPGSGHVINLKKR